MWLATELWAADHGGSRWTTWPIWPNALPKANEAGAETCTIQRLKDGPAWQTAREVRRVLTEFQKALHQAQGRSFKTMSSLPSAQSTCASSLAPPTTHARTVLAATYRQTPIHHALCHNAHQLLLIREELFIQSILFHARCISARLSRQTAAHHSLGFLAAPTEN